jgi:hypothetical protein
MNNDNEGVKQDESKIPNPQSPIIQKLILNNIYLFIITITS